MSRISLIIPTKNRVDFLMETLQNLYAQTRVPDEIIVVDDHSTDQTVSETTRNYPSVIVLSAEKNGPGAARNQGFKHSTGDLIKFIDSDDLITLNLIEDQASRLESSEVDAVYNSYFKASVSENGDWVQEDVVMHYDAVPGNKSIHKLMIRGYFIPIPTFMFRREILEKIGPWNDEIVAYEDFDFLWRLTRESENFAHSREAAMLYRIHGKQTTEANVSNLGREKDKYKCWEPIVREIHEDPSFSSMDRALIDFYFKKIKMHLALFEDSGESISYSGKEKMIEYLERFRNKIERMKTGTPWGKAFGPNASKEVFDSYIRMIKGNV